MGTHEVQAPSETDLERQAAISTDSTHMEVSRLCYKISRKYASEMAIINRGGDWTIY